MNSMMILPNDVIQITIDQILPSNINNILITIYNEYINNTFDHNIANDNLYYSLINLSSNYDISKKIMYNSLITLFQLRNTNSILRSLINSKCRYNIPTLLKHYINIFKDKHKAKMLYIRSDIEQKYIEATHCNSGCINCDKYLPNWWPSLLSENSNLSYIPKKVINRWNKKTDTYIRDGCCSFECYRDTRLPDLSDPYNSLLQIGQRRELFCIEKYCKARISPVQSAAFHIRFCCIDCQYEHNESQYKYYKRYKRYRYD